MCTLNPKITTKITKTKNQLKKTTVEIIWNHKKYSTQMKKRRKRKQRTDKTNKKHFVTIVKLSLF